MGAASPASSCSHNLHRDRAFQHGIVRAINFTCPPSAINDVISYKPSRWLNSERQGASFYGTDIEDAAIFSAIIIVGALVFPLGMVGMIEASTTRKFSIPWTRKCSSTTAIVSFPILHVPMA